MTDGPNLGLGQAKGLSLRGSDGLPRLLGPSPLGTTQNPSWLGKGFHKCNNYRGLEQTAIRC